MSNHPITLLRRCLGDVSGGTALEFAFAIPSLILMTAGVVQLGIGFLAQAGLRHGVETGARYATVYVKSASHTAEYPTVAEVKSKVTDSTFGLDKNSLSVADPVVGSANGQTYVQVSATYPVRFNFVFVTTPSFNLAYTRRSYRQ